VPTYVTRAAVLRAALALGGTPTLTGSPRTGYALGVGTRVLYAPSLTVLRTRIEEIVAARTYTLRAIAGIRLTPNAND